MVCRYLAVHAMMFGITPESLEEQVAKMYLLLFFRIRRIKLGVVLRLALLRRLLNS
jgi:hypothetical protein